MNFKDNYTITEGEKFIEMVSELVDGKEKKREVVHDKVLLSNDAFAIGEMIQMLIKKIEHARLSLI